MADVVTEAEVRAAVPTITAFWAPILTAGVNAQVSREVPEVTSSGVDALAEARVVVLSAVQAYAGGKSWIAQESAGPYSVTYRNRLLAGILSPADLAQLREIVGQAKPDLPGPVGEFPEPLSYGHLFYPRGTW